MVTHWYVAASFCQLLHVFAGIHNQDENLSESDDDESEDDGFDELEDDADDEGAEKNQETVETNPVEKQQVS